MKGFLFDIPAIKMTKGKTASGKVCKKCGKFKSLRHFSLNSNSKDGYRGSCKSCDRVAQHNCRQKMTYIHVDRKQCSDCGVIKPIDDFGIDKTKKDSHRSYCKECLTERSRSYKARPRTKVNLSKQI